MPVPVSVPRVAAKAAKKTRAKVAKAPARKPLGDAVVAAGALADEDAARAAAPPPPAKVTAPPARTATAEAAAPRASRKAARARQTAKAVAAPPKDAPAVPPPSPRRPRGAVPLAAWAHAVSDSPRPEPKRSEAKGLWRGIFRIPSEVALVEYGRGCRIHRLVIESPADALVDPY